MAYPYYNYPQYNSPTQNTMQTSGCVVVPSEDDVQKYPVAPNTAMAFILQDLSACYIKAMGASVLDAPRIAKYIRDISAQESSNQHSESTPAFALKEDIDQMQKQIDILSEQIKPLLVKTKSEVNNNDE